MILDNIIAGPIQNLTDARYFAARGVQGIFFDIRPKSRFYIPEYEAIAIKEWIEVKKIGFCMDNAHAVENILMAKNLFLDFIVTDRFDTGEAGRGTLPGFLWKGEYSGLKEALTAGRDVSSFSGFLISDFETGEAGFLKAAGIAGRSFITAEGGPEGVKNILDAGLGIHLTGGAEEKTGMKTYDELDEILDLIEERI